MSAPVRRSFAAGELPPAMHARADSAAYANGLKTLRNGTVMKTGGLTARTGTIYKGTTKSSGFARLIPVVFDDDQNYVLELGNGYLRIWLNGSLLQGVSAGTWANTTAYTLGIVITHSGVNYVCLQDHTSNTANDRPNDGTNRADYWYALTALIYELPTPWTSQAVVRALQYQVGATTITGTVRFAHNSTARRTLSRITATTWALEVSSSSVAAVAAPVNLTWTGSQSSAGVKYQVTAYDGVNALESLPSATLEAAEDLAALAGSNETLSWDAVTGATAYRVYRADENTAGVFGFVMGTSGVGFVDNGSLVADVGRTPPDSSTGSFGNPSEYPGVIGAYQQRVLLAGSTGAPATVSGSRVGAPDDFTVSTPLVDSDRVSWTMVGSRVIRPRHFLEVAQRLVLFANTGEFIIEGDETGIITPGAVNPRRISANGAATYPSPLEVNDSAVYVQARGSVVRDLLAGEAGSDLTVTGAHLVTGYTIVEWAYQATPDSIIWAVRSDGVLLSLTYQRDAGILAWAHHDTDGTVESVACVLESAEDALYAVVNRTINSSTVRYVERFAARSLTLAGAICTDASVTTTMAHPHSSLSMTAGAGTPTGDGYTHTGETATGSGGSGSFTAADVGRTFSFTYNSIRGYGRVTAYTSATVVTVTYWWPNGTDLTNPQVFTTGNWWWTSVGSLSHLALKSVSVVGIVGEAATIVASPYNPATLTTVTVSSAGIANLGGVLADLSNIASLSATGDATTAAYTSTVIGLPFVTDVETLDLDSAGVTRKDAGINLTRGGLWLKDARPPYLASVLPTSTTSVTGMQPMRATDEDGNTTASAITGFRQVGLDGAWANHGRLAIRHVDPSPLTILAIVPQGHVGRT